MIHIHMNEDIGDMSLAAFGLMEKTDPLATQTRNAAFNFDKYDLHG
jgi:hypothetical protein